MKTKEQLAESMYKFLGYKEIPPHAHREARLNMVGDIFCGLGFLTVLEKLWSRKDVQAVRFLKEDDGSGNVRTSIYKDFDQDNYHFIYPDRETSLFSVVDLYIERTTRPNNESR